MCRRILICLALFAYTFFNGDVQAEKIIRTQSPYFSNYTPYRQNHRHPRVAMYNSGAFNYGNFTDMSALEKYAFNKNYYGESNLRRLQRLESLAFGAIQQGNFDSRYEKVKEAILSRPQNTTKTSVLRSISNYFAGQLTGFEPPINGYYAGDFQNSQFYDNLPSNYGRTINDYSRSPWGSRYGTYNYGSGSGTGIQILD